MSRSARLLLASAMLVVALQACSPQAVEFSDADRIEIYTRAVSQLVADSGGPHDPLFIVATTSSPDGSGDRILSSEVRDDLADSLQPVADVVWVDAFDDVSLDSDGAPVGGGGIVILGDIETTEAGARAYAYIYHASLGAYGTTYVLEKSDDGTWRVTGTTGEVTQS